MVAKLNKATKATTTAPTTAKERDTLSRCRSLTKGAKTKLNSTAKAIGTRISRAKYKTATTVTPTMKFENANPAGTITLVPLHWQTAAIGLIGTPPERFHFGLRGTANVEGNVDARSPLLNL
jgi:hypothetical protein